MSPLENYDRGVLGVSLAGVVVSSSSFATWALPTPVLVAVSCYTLLGERLICLRVPHRNTFPLVVGGSSLLRLGRLGLLPYPSSSGF